MLSYNKSIDSARENVVVIDQYFIKKVEKFCFDRCTLI